MTDTNAPLAVDSAPDDLERYGDAMQHFDEHAPRAHDVAGRVALTFKSAVQPVGPSHTAE